MSGRMPWLDKLTFSWLAQPLLSIKHVLSAGQLLPQHNMCSLSTQPRAEALQKGCHATPSTGTCDVPIVLSFFQI